MKPQTIATVLDTALEARRLGEIFNPLFTGDAGLGKSFIAQSWVHKQQLRNPDFGFLDLRIAYLEQPDFVGWPKEVEVNGKWRTIHCLPSFWPTEGEGLLLLEEPNRGTTGTMNCLMQILTDRKVLDYPLPPGWIIAGCINPDSSEYDVNTMDTALKDRFVEFEIEFDHISFLTYINQENWHESVQLFVGSGIWKFKSPAELGKDGKYISPRTWAKVNAAEKCNIQNNRALHRIVVCSILGKDIGNEYHKFRFEQSPVTASDLLNDYEAAIKKLKLQSDPDTYQGDMIAATIESIEKHYGGLAKDCKPDQINEDIMAAVAKIIPSDAAVGLIKSSGLKQSKGAITEFFKEFSKRHPELVNVLKSNIKLTKAINAYDTVSKDKK